ncbi:MAG: HepT-like ribonuclease domain-containing protein [Planctomycetota bacterium]
MRPEAKKFLYDMQQACESLNGFMAGKTLDDYLQSELLRSAVERKLMIIGEALNRVLRLEPDLESQIPDARQIIDFRNILVHGYFAIEHETVWGILEKDLPVLTSQIQKLLRG